MSGGSGDSVVAALERAGGFARTRDLRDYPRRAIRQALADGSVVRVHHGRYGLPTAGEGRRAAHRLGGVVSHLSAAAYWEWEVKKVPPEPVVSVDRRRHLNPERRTGVKVRWRTDMAGVQVTSTGGSGPLVTSPLQTVVDCARDLPFDEALAVADSALRHRTVGTQELLAVAAAATRSQPARVLRQATPLAANPFESVLRAIALDVPGLNVIPQVTIRMAPRVVLVRPDLVDRRLRLVLEADSHEFHSSRKQLVTDCARYSNLVSYGWTVLRFTWEQVMFRAAWVAATIARTVQRLAPGS